jgi:hypothetical protein
MDDKPIYVDLCSPQVDICVYGSNERPMLLIDNLEGGLEVKKPYSQEHKLYVKVTEIGKNLSITGDEQWHVFQDAFLSNSVNDLVGEEVEEEESDESTEDSYELEHQQQLMASVEEIQKFMSEKLAGKLEKDMEKTTN